MGTLVAMHKPIDFLANLALPSGSFFFTYRPNTLLNS